MKSTVCADNQIPGTLMPKAKSTRLVETMSEDANSSDNLSESVIGTMADALKNAGIGDETAEQHEVVQQGDTDDLQELLDAGEDLSRQGRHKDAMAMFNKAISLDPANDMAWFNRGVMLEAQQDSRGAKQAFTICLDLNPNHGPASANLAILLERIGDLSEANIVATKALEHFPGHPSLVSLVQRTSDATEQEVEIEALERTQSYDEMNLVRAMDRAGIDDKEAVLAEAIHHDADMDEHLDEEELFAAAEIVAAAEEAQSIEREEPRVVPLPEVVEPVRVDIDQLVVKARDALKSGEAKDALSMLKPHLHTIASEHAEAWSISAGAMARLDLIDHAIGAYNHSIKLDETDAKNWYNIGVLQHRKSDNQSALDSLRAALSNDSAYSKAANKMYEIAQEIQDVTALIESLRMLSSSDLQRRSELALLLIELAEGEARILENMSGLPPTLPAGPELAREGLELLNEGQNTLRCRALSAMGDHINAVTGWKEIIKTNQNEPTNWFGLASALEAAGDLDTAAKCREKANALQNGVDAAPAPAPAPQQAYPEIQSPPVEQTQHAQEVLSTPPPQTRVEPSPEPSPQVDLARAALDATQKVERATPLSSSSNSIANQEIEWFNRGVGLIEEKKYRESLSCFDKALPSFQNDDAMVIRILNNRGNAFYFLEEYPKCIESYHQAMMINPAGVEGKTLYNMGAAYAEMERYPDAMKCFEQSIPRGLDKEAVKRAKEQIRRCTILHKERMKRLS